MTDYRPPHKQRKTSSDLTSTLQSNSSEENLRLSRTPDVGFVINEATLSATAASALPPHLSEKHFPKNYTFSLTNTKQIDQVISVVNSIIKLSHIFTEDFAHNLNFTGGYTKYDITSIIQPTYDSEILKSVIINLISCLFYQFSVNPAGNSTAESQSQAGSDQALTGSNQKIAIAASSHELTWSDQGQPNLFAVKSRKFDHNKIFLPDKKHPKNDIISQDILVLNPNPFDTNSKNKDQYLAKYFLKILNSEIKSSSALKEIMKLIKNFHKSKDNLHLSHNFKKINKKLKKLALPNNINHQIVENLILLMNQQQAILCGKFTDFLILKFARHLVVLLEFYVDEFVLQHILKLKKEAAADGSKPSEASLKESANAVKLKEFNALIEFFEKFSVILNSMNSKIKMTASSSANNQKLQVTDLIHEISVLIKSATKSNPELNKHAVLIKLVICNLLNYFDESFLSSTGVKSKDLTLSKSELELPINLNTSDDIDSFEASPRPVLALVLKIGAK